MHFLDHFRALEQRWITATVRYDPHSGDVYPSVQTTIHGQVAALERMYVQTDERLVHPKVRYIDGVGTRVAASPTPVTERIQPEGMGAGEALAAGTFSVREAPLTL